MKNGNFLEFRTDGTAALKMQDTRPCTPSATILPFPLGACDPSGKQDGFSLASVIESLHNRAIRILESSEMYCSLKYEDFRGCAYGAFTKRAITVLAGATSAIAAVSIIVGAA